MSGARERRSVALIGLRCSGKSSVGRRLAALLELPFVDLDLALAELYGEEHGQAAPTAGALLELLGGPRFRALEERALERALSGPDALVLATGGGTVESARNRELLERRCRCVWLRADRDVLRERMARDATQRPALTEAGALTEIELLERRRAPLYAELASFTLDTAAADTDELAQLLFAWMGA